MAETPTPSPQRMAFGFVVPQTRITGRMVLGLVIMALGALWTLDNLNLVESEPILDWWPLLIVAVGLAKLLGFGTRRHVAWGGIFTVAGLALLGDNFGYLRLSIWGLWPLILVVTGFAMLTRSVRRQRQGRVDEPASSLNTFAFWSGVERKVISQEFRGGEMTAVMGGVEIDLRPAKPVPEGAVVDVFVWWGGIDLRVPEGWRVVNEALVLLGAVEDKTKAPPQEARDTLIVRGLIVMGGVEIKN